MLIFESAAEERLITMAEQQNNEFTKSLILIGVIILIILVGGVSYFYASQSGNMTNSTVITNASTNMTQTTSANMTSSNGTEVNTANTTANISVVIEQNVTTQNYLVALQLGPPVRILTGNQTMNATGGEALVTRQVSSLIETNMTNAYYLQVHIYNITSDTAVTTQNVTLQIVDNMTNQTLTLPVIEMYDLKIGVSDTHFGNNAVLPPGSYTLIVTVENETAKFNINIANH